tara:strand:- start:448 stop:651 length:204 start_codon:yes stop_codon:yes gene_type:complete
MQRYITIARYDLGFNMERSTDQLDKAESAAQFAVTRRDALWAVVLNEDGEVLLHLVPEEHERKGEAA